jgi:hypothetical protein
LKTIHLNLARRPYRDYRPLYAVVVALSLLTAFLALNNFDTWYRYRRDTSTTRDEISRIESQIEQERRQMEVTNRQIKTIDLTSLSRQTKFINAQIAERAFSWSELLDRLEDVIPGNVRIVSVAPGFQENGLVRLSLNCEAKTSDGLETTINRFHRHPQFANPFPSSQDDTGAGYLFNLTVDYKPATPRVVSKR